MGEWLTLATIWVAMGLWCLGMVLSRRRAQLARWIWTAALLAYGAHIFLAYRHFYEWSHKVAWEATALDTKETIGIDSGFGLLANFLFSGILIFDVVKQWRIGARRGMGWIDWLILFFVLNGAVVFGEGAVRIYGIILLIAVLLNRVVLKQASDRPGSMVNRD